MTHVQIPVSVNPDEFKKRKQQMTTEELTTGENPFRDEPNQRERQIDAIIAAYYRAVEGGECIDQKDFIEKHPDVEKELCEFFRDSRLFRVLNH